MASKTLYTILSVPTKATPADIKKAYRKATKKAHPDHGGSVEGFTALKHAYDVLSDPERRARYDETGQADEVRPDNSNSVAMALVAAVLDDTISRCVQENRVVTSLDLVKVVEDVLERRAEEIRKQIQLVGKVRDAYQKTLGRFSRKKKKGADSEEPAQANVFEQIAQAKVRGAQLNLDQLAQNMRENDAALALVREHGFSFDLPLPSRGAYTDQKAYFNILMGERLFKGAGFFGDHST